MNLPDDKVDTILAQWQAQHDYLPLQAMGILGRLKRCVSLLDSQLVAQFAEFGINYGEFDVLAALRRSGEPFTLSPTELYCTLMITSGTMTNRLKNLQNKGLIHRQANPHDSRSLLVCLTDEGRALVDKVFLVHITNEEKMLRDLPEDILAHLNIGLKHLLLKWEHDD